MLFAGELVARSDYKKLGNRFHKKIERLLVQSGAVLISSEPHKAGPDIILEFDGKKIIVQCKYSHANKRYQNIENLINNYARRVQKVKAKVAILAFGGYQVGKSTLDHRKKILAENKVAIWTDNTISGYQILINSIGDSAKYQIMADLNLKSPASNLEVPAMSICQKDFTFYVTKLSPSFLVKAGYVPRRIDDPKSYQRFLDKKRVAHQIPGYIGGDIGVFPNSVILVSDYRLKFNNGKLTLKDQPSSLWILDGQHRVFAFKHVPNQEVSENYELVCSVFDGKSSKVNHMTQAQLFIKINNEAKGVPPALITDLAMTFESIEFYRMQMNIVNRLSKTAMFKDHFKKYRQSGGLLNPTTFATNQAMIRLTRENNGLIFNRIQAKKRPKDEEDRAFKYLRDYFHIVSSVFKKEWSQNPHKYILCSDRGIRGLLNLYIKILEHTKYNNNKQKVRAALKALKDRKPELRLEKNKRKFIGEAGARDLADSFAKLINEKIINFDSSVISRSMELQKELSIYNKRDKKKAEEFINGIINEFFEGTAYGELMHVDKSTFKYIFNLAKKCRKIRICFQDMKDKQKCSYFLSELKKKGIDIKLTQMPLHGRWLATDKYYLDLDTDLKDDAIASKKHGKYLYRINPDFEKIKNFKSDWNYYRKYSGAKVIYNYDPLSDQ